jgi:hypothetical protein
LNGKTDYAVEQTLLANLPVQQSAAKHLCPVSVTVSGQPLPARGAAKAEATAASDA